MNPQRPPSSTHLARSSIVTDNRRSSNGDSLAGTGTSPGGPDIPPPPNSSYCSFCGTPVPPELPPKAHPPLPIVSLLPPAPLPPLPLPPLLPMLPLPAAAKVISDLRVLAGMEPAWRWSAHRNASRSVWPSSAGEMVGFGVRAVGLGFMAFVRPPQRLMQCPLPSAPHAASLRCMMSDHAMSPCPPSQHSAS